MQNISPRSREIIDDLLNKKSVVEGINSIGPFDNTTIQVLKLLTDCFEDLNSDSGRQQVEKFYSLYLKAEQQAKEETKSPGSSAPTKQSAEGGSGDSDENDVEAKTSVTSADWRLTGLKSNSYRGVGSPGEFVEFPFDGRSTLIYGPNGSGKSSLVGAVIWALTGIAITDADHPVNEVPLHGTSSKGATKGKKISDWHVAATLPKVSPAGAIAECSVELVLSQKDNAQKLYIRRALPDHFEARKSETLPWEPCMDLSNYGITPLDLQLSLIAPSLFGRLTIEIAPNSGQLLTMMLGLDDLENIGKLAASIAPNRTRLSNDTKKEREAHWKVISESFGTLLDDLNVDSSIYAVLHKLKSTERPSLADIETAGKATKAHIDLINQSIAKALGLSDNAKDEKKNGAEVIKVSADLAGSLSSAVAKLKDNIELLFPTLNSLNPARYWNKKTDSTPGDWVESLDVNLNTFFEGARLSLSEHLNWLRTKAKKGSKTDLLLHAASFYDDKIGDCPVCEELIKKELIKSDLRTFKNLNPDLLKQLNDYFLGMRNDLDKIVPRNLQAIARQSPSDLASDDWKNLKKTFGSNLSSIIEKFEPRILSVTSGPQMAEAISLNLLPADAEKEFVTAAENFLKACDDARSAIAMLMWAEKTLPITNAELSKCLIQKDCNSLSDILSKGVDAANEADVLGKVKTALGNGYKTRKGIELLDGEILKLDGLEPPLIAIKELEKFATSVVIEEFEGIKDDTLSNWDSLYPEHTSGLSPANLFLEGRKERKVQSYLGQLNYEVAGQYFANAGLQRAIALSFFFALLKNHPKGLGFIVMDDSIVSLDDEHRERWSANILKPCMASFQFIFATHQEGYLKYGGGIDFAGELIVELNHRADHSRITWKPRHRLEKAEQTVNSSFEHVPNILRKYIEDLLLTFETYSKDPFFNQFDLEKSIKKYGSAGPPLKSHLQSQIHSILSNPKLLPVVNAGSHGATDHEIKKSMVVDQLLLLQKCEKKVGPELKRLEKLRVHNLRKRPVLIGSAEFPKLPNSANWNMPLTVPHLGSAAAKEDFVVIDGAELAKKIGLGCYAAVLVSGDTLDPVAKRGQWVLLGAEDEQITEGCLAAVVTGDNKRLLRRVWSRGEQWLLQSINPVARIPVETVSMELAAIRKVKGIIFEPRQLFSEGHLGAGAEWQESDILTTNDITSLKAVTVEGNSLDPIALKGQVVLMGEGKSVPSSQVSRGSLAILETVDDEIGNVIKRVYQSKDVWTLISPNPVDPHEPLRVKTADIKIVHPFRGVIFEVNN